MQLTRSLPLIVIVSLLLMLSVSSATAQDYEVGYEPTVCFDGVAADECAYVTVPEDRANPDGATIRIPVALILADDPEPDPVLFLSGGPGEPGLIYAQLAALFPNYDFIAFDHRGVNLAEPALDCTEYSDLIDMQNELEVSELAAASSQALTDCAARLREAGINLNAYTTSAAAADVFDVVTALGYDKVNLIGVSYGTRWAQEVMRDYPQIVNSAILDSVIPPEIDRPAQTPRAADQALQRVFAACATDAACSDAYPQLEATFNDVIADLRENPRDIVLDDEEIELNVESFMSAVFGSLYLQQGVSELPALITEVGAGDYTLLEEGAASVLLEALEANLSFGTFFATECNSEVSFSDPATQAATYEDLPFWEGVFATSAGIAAPFIYDICADMGLGDFDGDDNDPLTSDIPTLLTAGEFDPVTPFIWIEQAADGLSNVYSYEIPAFAHAAILQNPCTFGVLQSFLADPTTAPDTSCFAGLTLNFLIR